MRLHAQSDFAPSYDDEILARCGLEGLKRSIGGRTIALTERNHALYFAGPGEAVTCRLCMGRGAHTTPRARS